MITNNKMKSGQSKIQAVFSKFDNMVADLQTGMAALAEHKQRNLSTIAEKEAENKVIDADTERARKLEAGLKALLKG
jgi:hypothetical protein